MHTCHLLETALNEAALTNAFNGFDVSEFDEAAYHEKYQLCQTYDGWVPLGFSVARLDDVDVAVLEGNYAKQFAMADEEDDGPNFDVCDDMDGDHASALASIGWGTDEDYGFFGED